MNRGLIIVPIEPEHYVFGDGLLGDAPILTDGNWSQWLPIAEDQNFGFEPMCCTSFALLNCVETMLRQKYGATDNFSDRLLAYLSGTTQAGNDPHTVAETLRKKGDVAQMDWDYTPAIQTWDAFYTKPPAHLLWEALEFCAQYAFGHSWVNPNQQAMMDALNYSPLSAGVYAWSLKDGLYVNPPGAQANHDIMVYGYERNKYWLIFDSYDSNVKKLAWDFPFVGIKRYTLNRQTTPTKTSGWDKVLAMLQSITESVKALFGAV